MNNNSNILILFFGIFLIFLFINQFLLISKSENNEDFNNTKIKIYNFNTSWCGHSLKFQPIWESFVKSLNTTDNIITYDVKCDNDKNKKLIDKYYVEGYPTVIIDYGNMFIKYTGPRTVNDLRSTLNLKQIKELNLKDLNNNIKCGNKIDTNPTKIINFDKIEGPKETTIYNFNTSWCGYSVRFQPIWDKFTENNKNSDIKIIDVKCDNSENDDLCNKYSIEGYPTILKVKQNVITPFNGSRTLEGLQEFLN
jgi:thiol-disulfide isomerase/thioredoxin